MAEFKYMNEVRTQELIGQIKTKLSGKLTQYTTMPSANAVSPNTVVLYIGATDGSYTQGDLYKADVTNNQWIKLSYNADEIDAMVSASGSYEPIGQLPTENIQTNIIYLVPYTEEITGYYDGTEHNPVYVSTGTSSDPSYDKYVYNITLGVYQYDKTITGQDAQDIKDLIDTGTYTETTVTAIVKGNTTFIQYINIDGTPDGWQEIGSADIDLSEYVKYTDLVPITSAELAAMWED